MTPEEQRAPKAFLKVYVDDRPDELSFERPADLGNAFLMELVDRNLLMMFIDDAEKLKAQIAAMNKDASIMAARSERMEAEEELDEIASLAQTLEFRSWRLKNALGLKSD